MKRSYWRNKRDQKLIRRNDEAERQSLYKPRLKEISTPLASLLKKSIETSKGSPNEYGFCLSVERQLLIKGKISAKQLNAIQRIARSVLTEKCPEIYY